MKEDINIIIIKLLLIIKKKLYYIYEILNYKIIKYKYNT